MKVHVNLQPVPNQTTGIGVYTHEITRRLAGYEGLVLQGGINSLRNGSFDIFDSYPFPVHISRIPERLIYDRPAARLAPVTYNRLMHDPSETLIFFANRLPSLRIEGRIVAVIHDLTPLRIPLELPGIEARFRRRVDDIKARADTIITVSEFSRRDICSTLDIEPARVRIVPNGVDLDAFQSPVGPARQASVRARYNLPERYVLYFGGTRPYKNVATIIAAYASLGPDIRRHVKLVVTRRQDELQHLATTLGVASDVVFTLPIEAADKIAVYQMATLSVLVSRYEGFGIPVIESMAAGTPVIASDVASLPEVSGGAAALVSPDDTQALSRYIEQVVQDADVRQRMVERGRENASRYSWDDAAQRLFPILME